MLTRPRIAAVTGVLVLASLVGCSSSGADPTAAPVASGSVAASASGSTPTTSPVDPRVSGTVASDLQVPWGLAFLPDGSALVSQRDEGSIVRVSADGVTTPVGTVPGVLAGGEGGLLGLALSPNYAKDQLVYAYLTTARDNRVVRMTYDGSRLGTPQVVVSGLEKGAIHDGGRIAFGPDGFLYIGVGDTGRRELAQDLNSRNGKILRVTATGKPAPGNPFKNSAVYSYGHRNVQGLAWDSKKRLWASEFGQNTWDELNLIEPGGNYGWPIVEGGSKDKRFIDPVAQWSTEEASPSGIAIVRDTVLMAGLRGQRLWAIDVHGGKKVGTPQAFFVGSQGRLRTVAAAPDGTVWVVTSNTDGRGDAKRGDDRILRVVY